MQPDAQRDSQNDSPVPPSLSYAVIGAFFAVYNELRYGHLESVYCNALSMEFQDRGIQFEREPGVEVYYRGRPAGFFRPDFLVEGVLVLEAKSTYALADAHSRQLLNCLAATRIELGLLLHFGPRAKVVRVVNTVKRDLRRQLG